MKEWLSVVIWAVLIAIVVAIAFLGGAFLIAAFIGFVAVVLILGQVGRAIKSVIAGSIIFWIWNSFITNSFETRKLPWIGTVAAVFLVLFAKAILFPSPSQNVEVNVVKVKGPRRRAGSRSTDDTVIDV